MCVARVDEFRRRGQLRRRGRGLRRQRGRLHRRPGSGWQRRRRRHPRLLVLGRLRLLHLGPFSGAGATAHDNTAHGNMICNSGPPPQPRDPLDETNGTNVTGTVNVSDCAALPSAAAAVVAAAGPR